MPAPREILDLVARFEQQLEAYKSGQYNETQVRREFLDPLFKALGWDIDNVQGFAEAYKDVIREDQIRIAGATKAPDYCFRIGGTRKYFLEAKKPSVVIKDEPAPAYQLRRYAWSAKLPLSILSDFEEFAAYDGRVKPHKDDSASVARIFYGTFRDFAEKWDWIHERFSRDAVLKGAFDKFAESTKTKRGTTEVDAAFLAEIEGWRSELAKNLALRNAKLTQRELNFAVQRIIDRVIFLRICEDRGIEDYGRLRALVNGDRIYPRLCQLFEQADGRYNSGLFHFKKEAGRHEAPDELTLDLDLDDKLLRDRLRSLYYPDSPYEFSVISADILGQVYEQFLGKVIRLIPHGGTNRAVVDDKPEVKKAGGVYYTPTYIVDYIVRQTVGKLIADISGEPVSGCPLPPHPQHPQGEATMPMSSGTSKAADSTPALDTILPLPQGPQGEGRGERKPDAQSARSVTATLNRVAKLRILDPACGSGSFLIGAYQFLLDWHLQFYLANDPAKFTRGNRPALVQTGKGWKLTIAERKRIVLANIYGVDIDAQAVEVTKLSLLLKVLEGETGQTLQTIFRLFQERALPDLGDNIKCGNSLIGPDFNAGSAPASGAAGDALVAGQGGRREGVTTNARGAHAPQTQLALFNLTDEERYRINVFDWQAEFADIFKAGGFDAVIGNPPYIRIQTMQDSQPQEVEFFSHAYKAASQGNYDIYVVFVERGLSLLNRSGKLGFILPHKFFNSQYGEPLRGLVAQGKHLSHVVHFGDKQVFSGATTYTCLLFLEQHGVKECLVTKVDDLAAWRAQRVGLSGRIKATDIGRSEWNFAVGQGAKLFEQLQKLPTRLGDVASRMGQGPITSADTVYLFKDYRAAKKGKTEVFSKELDEWVTVESTLLKPVVRSGSIKRYKAEATALVLFPYHVENCEATLFSPTEMSKDFPLAWEYLKRNKALLARREKGKFQDQSWYRFGRTQNLGMWEQPKLMIPYMTTELATYLDREDDYYFINVTTGGYGITSDEAHGSFAYLCGLLNSRLLNFFFKKVASPFHGGYFAANKQFIERLPIRTINFSDKSDKALHNMMVTLVEQMLELHKQLAVARTPQEQTALERQIAATDTQIDRLVYALYGLTEDEIKIVEGKADTATAAGTPTGDATTPKRIRKKPAYAKPPPGPSQPGITPEKAYADAAHHYGMGKEETPPYQTGPGKYSGALFSIPCDSSVASRQAKSVSTGRARARRGRSVFIRG